MKHLLDIKYFLTEALTPKFQQMYKNHFEKRKQGVQARLNNLLDNKERIYIPYNSETISETQLKVKSYLEELGYNIFDYKQNLSVQIENSKRQIRISKLLTKNPKLLKEFTLDDTRANTRAGSEFMIALTSNYEDVAGMSFERCWTNSCLDIRGGSNKRYVAHEVKQGTVVAYLIKSDDLNIENPLGRVNIKPFYNLKDKKEVIYVTDLRVYGNVPDEKLFLSIIKDYLKEKQEVKIGGFFEKIKDLYSDGGSPEGVLITKDYSLCYGGNCFDEDGYDREGYDKEGFNREGFDKDGVSKNGDYPYKEHLTREQYRFLKDYVRGTFDVDENGLVNVDGVVGISSKGLTEFPVKFGTVSGIFSCYGNNLTSLEGAPSIVRGWFDCSNNPNLTSLVGAPSKVWDFYCSNNNLTSLEGAPEVDWYFYCSNNNLTSLVGAPKEVRDFYCNGNNLTSLVGAPKEVRGFYCHNQKNGHQFTKEDVWEVSKVSGEITV